MRVWNPRKRSKKMRENKICRLQRFFRDACMLIQTHTLKACVSYRRIQSVLLRWVPSLNIRSKLKGQCTDVKSGCVTLVRPSLSPHSLSWKQKSCATVPLSYRRCQYTHTLFSCKMGIVLNCLWCYVVVIIRRETISYVQLQSFLSGK